jgi:exodeoxyribonuclease VII large subunit
MVCAVVSGVDELVAGDPTDALSVGELYGEVAVALARAFPRTRELWVRGEIQNLTEARSGHGYLELVDPDGAHDKNAPALKVNCWSSKWGPIKRALAREGAVLEKGTVVTMRGRVEFYAPRGQVNFIADALDVTALLGALAAKRAALLRQLGAEGLLEANRALTVPPVPLRIGLVASPGTEGYRDFVGQLEGSGYAFEVRVVAVRVQGAGAPGALARAIRTLGGAGCDVVVVVRGGGSKGDLAAFDTEAVARAVATSPVPVWTGIGHTGDESVADLVANRHFITPTGCGQELAGRVGSWWDAVVGGSATQIGRAAVGSVAGAAEQSQVARGRLAATARHVVALQSERLGAQRTKVARGAPRLVDDAHRAVSARAGRLGPAARHHVDRGDDRLGHWRRLLAAYDVDRQLERGYTLTLDADDRPLRSVAALVAGSVLSTRFADGSTRSLVEAVVRAPGGPTPGPVVEDRGAHPGQESR